MPVWGLRIVMVRTELKLFSHFELRLQDQQEPQLSSPRLQALIAWLVVHRQGPQPRERAASDLWPDSPDSQARTNLRNLLHRLKSLAPVLHAQISDENGILRWNPEPGFVVDVASFDAASEHAASTSVLTAAMNLYTGPLLPSCHDDWLEPHRQRLALQYEHLLTQAIHRFDQDRNWSAAIDAAQRLLATNPLREDAYRELMRLHATTGDRATALKLYRQCAETLEQELGVFPSEPTRELARRLRKETSHRDGSGKEGAGKEGKSSPPISGLLFPIQRLIGRRTEWSQLQALWSRANAGRLSMVLLEGQSGTGKTRLAEELQHWAHQQGIALSSARCYPTPQQLAYGTAITLLKSCPVESLPELWQSELSPLLPERVKSRVMPTQDRPPEPFVRHRLMEAITRAMNLQPPRLVSIDDIQWCDPDTLDWLSTLATQSGPSRLMVVMTLCTEELPADHPSTALLHALQRAGILSRITIGPLGTHESLELVEETRSHPLAQERVQWLLNRSAGNPLLLIEMLRAGLTAGPDASPASLPTTIQTVFERRLSRLSPSARAVAELASVLGDLCSTQHLERLTPFTSEALLDGTEELWGRGILLEDSAGRLSFCHGLFADFIYRQMSSFKRRTRHQQVADSLQSRHPTSLIDLLTLARHLELGGRLEQAFSTLVRAGQKALAQTAYAQAHHCFQYALSLLPSGSTLEEHHAALMGLEVTSQVMGNLELQQQVLSVLLEQAEAQSNPAWMADCLYRYSRYSRLHGKNELALKYADDATDYAAQAGDPLLETHAWLEHALAILHFTGDIAAMLEDLNRAFELSRQLNHKPLQALIKARSAWCLHRLNQKEKALSTVLEAQALARAVGDKAELARVLLHQSRLCQSLGRWMDATQVLEEGRALASESGHTTLYSAVLGDLSRVYLHRGFYQKALDDLSEATRLLLPYPYAWVHNTYRMQMVGVLLALGETPLALSLLAYCQEQLHKYRNSHGVIGFVFQLWLAATFDHWEVGDIIIPTMPELGQGHSLETMPSEELSYVLYLKAREIREGRPTDVLSITKNMMERFKHSLPLHDSLLDLREVVTVMISCLLSVHDEAQAKALAQLVAEDLLRGADGMLNPRRAFQLTSQLLLGTEQHALAEQLQLQGQLVEEALVQERARRPLGALAPELRTLFLTPSPTASQAAMPRAPQSLPRLN